MTSMTQNPSSMVSNSVRNRASLVTSADSTRARSTAAQVRSAASCTRAISPRSSAGAARRAPTGRPRTPHPSRAARRRRRARPCARTRHARPIRNPGRGPHVGLAHHLAALIERQHARAERRGRMLPAESRNAAGVIAQHAIPVASHLEVDDARRAQVFAEGGRLATYSASIGSPTGRNASPSATRKAWRASLARVRSSASF